MIRGKTIRKWVAAVAAAVLVAGCSSKPSDQPAVADPPVSQAKSHSLSYVMAYPPVTLDPPNIEDSGSAHIAIHVTEPLIMIGTDNQLKPHLALGWKANADASVWTVKLRENVKFSDGTPFNADAVKFTFDRAVDPNKPTKQRARLSEIAQVRVVDPLTVEFVLKAPYVDLPYLLTQSVMFIVSPAAARQAGDGFASKSVGTGPFMVESFTSNEGAVLKKNPNYWQSMGNVDRVEVRRVSEYSTRRFMLEKGEANVIQDVVPEDVEALKQVKGVTILRRSSTRQFMVSMNVLVKPFHDKRVRQALNYAVNKEQIVQHLFKQTAIRADSPVPPSVEGYKTVGAYPYDPDKAKALLAEAGYPNGFEANLWGPTPGRLLMGSESVEQIQADLAKVGVRVKISEADGAANVRRITLPPDESAKEGKHLMYLGGPASRGLQAFFEDFFTTASWAPKGSNRQFYSNPRVDQLVAEAGRTGDPAKREQLYSEIQTILMDDAPWIFLYTISLLWGHSTNLEGLEFLPNDLVLLTKATFK